MAPRGDSRFTRIDRFSFGRLISRLLGIALGSAIALGIMVFGIDYYRENPGLLTVLSLVIGTGPVAGWGLYMANGALLSLVRQFGRRRVEVDLDAPEIVIPRRMPPRVLPSLGALWFALFMGAILLGKLREAETDASNPVGVAVMLFIFVGVPLRNVWTMWRWKARDFVPVVLDAEGLLDHSVTDMPRLPWRDIEDIDLDAGLITLTGETKIWVEAKAPDRRWFTRLRGQRPPPRLRLNYGLQPDDYCALSLVRAYWQRRIASPAVDARVAPKPVVQRG
ncbi:hypothetical protein [Dongia sp. agr-C8]